MMTAEDRVKTVAEFGFTERQARFLVMVMRHAGICVPRQYAAFAGTAYGRRVNALFDGLVERGYATICGCLHNRARLYHVRHHALYHAIGEPHSRYRRPVPAASVSTRLMTLDELGRNHVNDGAHCDPHGPDTCIANDCSEGTSAARRLSHWDRLLPGSYCRRIRDSRLGREPDRKTLGFMYHTAMSRALTRRQPRGQRCVYW